MNGTRLQCVFRYLREPLVQFVGLGAALAALHGLIAPSPARRIALSDDALHGLRQEYVRRNGRAPSGADEAAMVRRFVDDEVLYREALAQGLDRGDVIVRRRLVQKMEFIIEGMDPVPPPSEEELQAYLDAHSDQYAVPERVAVTHVYISSDGHPQDGEALALELRRRVVAGEDSARLGDPFIRGQHFDLQSERQLAGIFGATFARAVMSVPTGQWSEPLRSSYGLHLARIDQRRPGHVPSLAEVRTAVARDWEADRRVEMNRAAIERLRRQYDIRLPEAVDGGASAASASQSSRTAG